MKTKTKTKTEMKRVAVILFLLFAFFSLSACEPGNESSYKPVEQPGTSGESSGDNSDQTEGNAPGDTSGESTEEEPDVERPDEPNVPSQGVQGRYLVVYCSRSGNTEQVAEQIRTTLRCDILEVEPATPYEQDYQAMLARAQEEIAAIRAGSYPQIKTSVEDFDAYDVVLVGYPIWYGSMATPMQSFLHEHAAKLRGKRIALFATSGSSGMTASVGEAETLCSESEVVAETLLLTSSSMAQMASRVTSWLDRLGLQPETNDQENGGDVMESNTIKLTVGGKSFTATLAENSSAAALKERLAQGSVSIRMNDYGDMEKVGSLGFSLPRNDERITTRPGDLILYQGNSFVIYYDTNSWSLTRLGRVDGVSTRSQMLELLGGAGSVEVTLSME